METKQRGEEVAGNAEVHVPAEMYLIVLECVVLNSCTLGNSRLISLVPACSLDEGSLGAVQC